MLRPIFCILFVASGPALAQASGAFASLVPCLAESGRLGNGGPATAPVWSHVLNVAGASSLQVRFDVAELGSDEDAVVLSGVQDGAVQLLGRIQLIQWRNQSAWFNGPAVVVSLHLAPGSTGQVAITAVLAGQPGPGLDTLCGADNRVGSTDARNCRMVASAVATASWCSGFLIDAQSTVLSAGHCGDAPSVLVVAEFGVPASTSFGVIQHPPPAFQYAVDTNSFWSANLGNNDWAVMRLFPNSTGNSASVNQGVWFTLASTVPSGAGTVLRITGYGLDTTPNSASGTQQTSLGPLVAGTATVVSYQVDTEGGSSGSPVFVEATQQVIAIHTTGGCTATGGSNSGTSILNSGLQSVISSITGCAQVTLAPAASQALTCTPTLFTVNPQGQVWHGVAVSGSGNWNIQIGGTASTTSGSACDFLLANGHLGAIPQASGQASLQSGAPQGTIEYQVAVPLVPGTPASAPWTAQSVLALFEFNVSSSGAYDIAVIGDASLAWRLYGPGTSNAWRPRSSSTLVASGSVTGGVQSAVNLSPGWHVIAVFRDGGAGSTSLPNVLASVCPAAAVAALSNVTPRIISNGCQEFSLTAVPGTWQGVAISSATDDWDLLIGPVNSALTGAACDFAVANGSIGTVTPLSGFFARNAPSGSATAEARGSSVLVPGSPLAGTLPAGSILRIHEVTVVSPSAFDILVAGDPLLSWAVFDAGVDAGWRPRSAALASGTFGGGGGTGINLSAGQCVIVIFRDGGPAPSAAAYTIGFCSSASGVSLAAPSATAQVSNTCQGFSLTPSGGFWNVVAVSGSDDWNLTIGGAVSQAPGNACDFAAANGHLGPITPTSGSVTRNSGTSPGTLEHAPRTTLVPGVPLSLAWGSGDVAQIAEFNVTAPGLYNFSLSGAGSLNWHLMTPGVDAAWRDRSAAVASGTVGGPVVSGWPLNAGWHALILSRDGGPGSATNVTISITQFQSPPPVLLSLSPASAVAGYTGLTLTLTGSGFVPSTTALWNGTPLPTTYAGGTTLTAAVSAAHVATAGLITITVTTPPPGGGTSLGQVFTVAHRVPILLSISPSTAPAGTAGLTIAFAGGGFTSQSVPQWNGLALAVNSVVAGQIVAAVPASLLATPGVFSLTVFNPPPGGGTSAARPFYITPPVISSISPASLVPMQPGSSPVTLAISGSSFVPASTVFANGVALPTTYTGAPQLTAMLGPAIPQALIPGGVALTVENTPVAVSNTVALIIGSGSNRGTIRTAPLATQPGQVFSLLLEGGNPLAPFSLFMDLGGVTPLTGWPTPAAGFVLAVGPATGSAGPLVLVLDGLGILGPPLPVTLLANGSFAIPNLVLPQPSLGFSATLQAVSADPASPAGATLTWARYPLSL